MYSKSPSVLKKLVETGTNSPEVLNYRDSEGKNALHIASETGDLGLVTVLLENHPKDDKDKNGCTALVLALNKGHFRVVEFLLHSGASSNTSDIKGDTPLHYISGFKQELLKEKDINLFFEIFELIILLGADINQQNKIGETPLIKACREGQELATYFLLIQKARSDLYTKSNVGPLHVAVRMQHVSIIELLLKFGVSAEEKTPRGSALDMAADLPNSEIGKLLREGSSISSKSFVKYQKLYDEYKQWHDKKLKKRENSSGKLSNFPFLNAKGKETRNQTILHAAVKQRNKHLVTKLLVYKEGFVTDLDAEKKTPLHVAAHEGFTKIVQTLLDAGASVNAQDISGLTPLNCAASQGWWEVCNVLLEGNAIANITNNEGMSPLHFAVRNKVIDPYEYLYTLHLLTEARVDVNALTSGGESPLSMAALRGNNIALLFLLKKLALPNQILIDGMTALHFAGAYGHKHTVMLLLQYGADINIKSPKHGTVMQMVEKSGNKEIMQILFEYSSITQKYTPESPTLRSLETTIINFYDWLEKKKSGKLKDEEKPVKASYSETMKTIKKSAKRNINWQQLSQMSRPTEDKFQLLKKLGEGGSGQVYCAQYKENGFVVAIKTVLVTPTQKSIIEKEIEVLQKVNHPNIVQYYGFYVSSPTEVSLIMEYCEVGSVIDLITGCGKGVISETDIAAILFFVLQGLKYLHSQKIIHRDMKAENILVTRDAKLKIADFGVSAIDDGQQVKTIVGTPKFQSPEVLNGEKYSNTTDIWSLGVVAIQLADRAPPFCNINPIKAMYLIMNGTVPTLQKPENWSQSLQNFISVCLQRKPETRPSAEELLQHSLFGSTSPIYSRLLAQLVKDFFEMAQVEKKPPSKRPLNKRTNSGIGSGGAGSGVSGSGGSSGSGGNSGSGSHIGQPVSATSSNSSQGSTSSEGSTSGNEKILINPNPQNRRSAFLQKPKTFPKKSLLGEKEENSSDNSSTSSTETSSGSTPILPTAQSVDALSNSFDIPSRHARKKSHDAHSETSSPNRVSVQSQDDSEILSRKSHRKENSMGEFARKRLSKRPNDEPESPARTNFWSPHEKSSSSPSPIPSTPNSQSPSSSNQSSPVVPQPVQPVVGSSVMAPSPRSSSQPSLVAPPVNPSTGGSHHRKMEITDLVRLLCSELEKQKVKVQELEEAVHDQLGRIRKLESEREHDKKLISQLQTEVNSLKTDKKHSKA